MREIKMKIYKFNELSQGAQNKVINKTIDIIIDTTDFENLHKNSNLYKAYNECRRLQTPWFLHQYIYDYCKKNIISICKTYEYFADGGIF